MKIQKFKQEIINIDLKELIEKLGLKYDDSFDYHICVDHNLDTGKDEAVITLTQIDGTIK